LWRAEEHAGLRGARLTGQQDGARGGGSFGCGAWRQEKALVRQFQGRRSVSRGGSSPAKGKTGAAARGGRRRRQQGKVWGQGEAGRGGWQAKGGACGRWAEKTGGDGGLPCFQAVGRLKMDWGTWLQIQKSLGGYL